MLSYKRNDLKRLTKDELIGIANDSVENSSGLKRLKKCDIIDLICIPRTTPTATSSPAAECEPESTFDITRQEFAYKRLSDPDLADLPDITFQAIYTFITDRTTDCESSCKALDRAVKHTSAGDVSDVAYSKVGQECSRITI